VELTCELKKPTIKWGTAIPGQAQMTPDALIKPADAPVAKPQGGPAQKVSPPKRPFTVVLGIAAQKDFFPQYCARCPAWSMMETGTLTDPVPYLCEIARARKERYEQPD
jgi:hypothetical protein